MAEQESFGARRGDGRTSTFPAFVAGLQAMSTRFDAVVRDFAVASTLLSGSHDEVQAQIAGMIEFAHLLMSEGEEAAWQAIERESGVPVRVQAGYRGSFPAGLIVGLEGAEYVGELRTAAFNVVAVVPNGRGQEAFIRVWITPDGQTIVLKPSSRQFGFPETRRLMRDL